MKLTTPTILRLIGLVLIVLATTISLVLNCPTNIQLFIIYALMGIGLALIFPKSADKSTGKINMGNWGFTVAGGIVLPIALIIINPIQWWKQDNCNFLMSSTGVTVVVHGGKGKLDMILRQKGFIIMDIKGERKRASINENGLAFFQNLNVGDSVRIEIDFSEPFKSIQPDSVYIIQSNSIIYLEVNLQGIDKVKGMVLYNDSPLNGVTVKLIGKEGYLLDTTKQTGDFNFEIPEAMQNNEYQVWFIKEGFVTKSTPAFPQTGEPLNIIMEKSAKAF